LFSSRNYRWQWSKITSPKRFAHFKKTAREKTTAQTSSCSLSSAVRRSSFVVFFRSFHIIALKPRLYQGYSGTVF
jgi:hypothetical protein